MNKRHKLFNEQMAQQMAQQQQGLQEKIDQKVDNSLKDGDEVRSLREQQFDDTKVDTYDKDALPGDSA